MSLTQINKAGLDEIALDHVFTIGASGSSAYTFQGEGLNGTVNNPTLYLTRGKTYRFENGSGGHPIRIQSTSGASGTAYNTGVTNNAGSGTVIVEVQHDAPDVLYYQCTSHAAMNGILYITGALADGGVTTAKLADDAVTSAKIANGAVDTAQINNDAITTQQIADGTITAGDLADSAITTAKIADNNITAAKLADDSIQNRHFTPGSVNTADIADDAVTIAKLADDAVGTTQIANDAVTAAKIGTNAVTEAKIQAFAVSETKIGDQAVTLAKLQHGTSSNDGKFLRANNGADPSFETVSTDLVNDTSPQLGGDLLQNGNSIVGYNNEKHKFGNSGNMEIYHTGSTGIIKNTDTSNLILQANQVAILNSPGNSTRAWFGASNAAQLYYNNAEKFATKDYGVQITGYQSTTSMVGFVVRGNYNGYGFGTDHSSSITNFDLDYYSPIPMFGNRTTQSGSSYLTFPSYAGGNYIKFTAPVSGLYQFELIASVEAHSGGDWLSFSWEKNVSTASSSSEMQSNFEGACAIFERVGGTDAGMGNHFSTTRFLSANDYVVLYQQSAAAIRFKNAPYLVRGHLIN